MEIVRMVLSPRNKHLPKSFKQEGMCVRTSIINIIEMGCGITLSNDLVNEFVRDNTPGVSPVTLKEGVNEIARIVNKTTPELCNLNQFQRYNSSSSDDFITDLYLLLAQGSGRSMINRKSIFGINSSKKPVAYLFRTQTEGYLVHTG